MSYARFGPDSDVYVYASTAGGVECCRCRFIAETQEPPRNNAVMVDEDEMIAHLKKHRRAGHRVPNEAFEELRADRDARASGDG
ncbi:MAG: hypothetical protein AUH39_02680 [Chloroflexi bacterium 13_1_40CM_67_9]|nr:MAG: hypothetical protein AUH39_02680 [Chloroflexi bacterium 13_1_40CM_67_9]